MSALGDSLRAAADAADAQALLLADHELRLSTLETPEPSGIPVPADATAQWFDQFTEGAVFRFTEPRYVLKGIRRKPNQQFLGPLRLTPTHQATTPGGVAVADWAHDGQSPITTIVSPGGTGGLFVDQAIGCTVSGLEIIGFARGRQQPTVPGSKGGTYEHLWVHDNIGRGMNVPTILRHFRIEANSVVGLGGSGYDLDVSDGSLIGNTTDESVNMHWESGSKIVNSTGTLKRIYSAHNRGVGIWPDINNGYNRDTGSFDGLTIESCLVEHNAGVGISYEISYNGLIRDNIVRYNANDDERPAQLWRSQILIHSSPRTKAIGNLLVSRRGTHTMGVITPDRSRHEDQFDAPEPYSSRDFEVSGNTFRYEHAGGRVGVAHSNPQQLGDVWDRNRYEAPQFWWDGKRFERAAVIDWNEWRASTGFDAHSERVVT